LALKLKLKVWRIGSRKKRGTGIENMYVIIVYDIEQARVAKVCKYLRRFLSWVQNSVFEGNLTEAKLKEVKIGLKDRIKEDADSILFYCLQDKSYIERDFMGVEKNPTDTFI
jgi:CRISPR-associated protein Cas2